MGALYSRLICPICLQKYDTPKLLPCLHSVCQNCLQKCIENSTVSEEKGHQFQCPVCMKIVTKPLADLPVEKWAGHFPVNAVLQSLLPKAKTKLDQLCDPCLYGGKSITATSYCATCEEVLCQMCDNVHRRSKATREHTFLRLDEIVNPAIAGTLAVSTTCTYHWNKLVEFYCVSHDAMCCSDCVVDCHRRCNDILKLKQHVDKLFKDEEPLMITERIKQLDNHLDTYTAANNKTLLELKTSTEDITVEIDKLIATLNKAKFRISKEREGLLAEESRKRLSENQQCQSLKATLKDSLHLIDAVVKYGDKHQSLVILHKIKEQLAYCEKTIHDKHPGVREVTVKLPLNEHFISLRKRIGSKVAKIEVTENKIKLCLPVHQNCAVSSDLIWTTPDEGLTSTATTSRDLDPDEDENEVEKSSDVDEQKFRASDFSSTHFEINEKSKDLEIESLKQMGNKRETYVTFENTAGDLSYPSTWTKMSANENLKCVTLDPSDKEYKDVFQKFLASVRCSGQQRPVSAYDMIFGSPQLIVIKIERVQNMSLYQQYKAKKRHMEQQNSGKANEKELWHGTAGTYIKNINNNGFKSSHGGSGSHGAGTYFAVNASYSVGGYCSPDASGHRHIYLANVLTGDSVVAGSATCVLPPKDPRYPHITYDSTTDSTVNPQMFVIIHDTQAYPSYLITFC